MTLGLQPIHLVVILIVALLIFGPQKLPEFSRNIGRAIAEFKRSSAEITNGFQNEVVKPLTGTMDTTQNPTQNVAGQPVGVPAQPTGAQAQLPVQASLPDPAAQEAPLTLVCDKCGTKNPSDALFCKRCGNGFPLPTE